VYYNKLIYGGSTCSAGFCQNNTVQSASVFSILCCSTSQPESVCSYSPEP